MISGTKQTSAEAKTRYSKVLAFESKHTNGTSSLTWRLTQQQQVRATSLAYAKGSVQHPPKV